MWQNHHQFENYRVKGNQHETKHDGRFRLVLTHPHLPGSVTAYLDVALCAIWDRLPRPDWVCLEMILKVRAMTDPLAVGSQRETKRKPLTCSGIENHPCAEKLSLPLPASANDLGHGRHVHHFWCGSNCSNS